ncbi:MAG: hypothetical protein V9G98_13045 [Candidatus Competibacter sp.]
MRLCFQLPRLPVGVAGPSLAYPAALWSRQPGASSGSAALRIRRRCHRVKGALGLMVTAWPAMPAMTAERA